MSGGLAEAVIGRMIGQRDLMWAMNQHCQSMLARVQSPDGTVSVQVDGLGAMTDLRLSESAYRHGAEALSSLIVSTARAAAAVAANRQRELLVEFTRRLTALQRAPLIDVGDDLHASGPMGDDG